MKRNVLSVMTSLLIAGTLLGAQSAPAQDQPAPSQPAPQAPAPAAASPSQDNPDDKTLTGCLVQGSGPNVFILDHAKAEDAPAAKEQKFLVTISAQPDQIKSIVNSQVRIVGSVQPGKSASADDKKLEENDLPKLTARRITRTSATCPATGD